MTKLLSSVPSIEISAVKNTFACIRRFLKHPDCTYLKGEQKFSSGWKKRRRKLPDVTTGRSQHWWNNNIEILSVLVCCERGLKNHSTPCIHVRRNEFLNIPASQVIQQMISPITGPMRKTCKPHKNTMIILFW